MNLHSLILTHRRNAAVVIWDADLVEGQCGAFLRFADLFKVKDSLKLLASSLNDHLNGQCDLLPAQCADLELRCGENIVLNTPRMLVLQSKEFLVAFGKEQTAEVLASLYQQALHLLKLTCAEVKKLVLGTGPGSFTGLRLGCAFANGLLLSNLCHRGNPMGSSRLSQDLALTHNSSLLQGYAVPCWHPSVNLFKSVIKNMDNGRKTIEEFDGAAPPDQYFASAIDAWDVLAAVLAFELGAFEQTQEFLPAYGREPGPVIKLRLQENKLT